MDPKNPIGPVGVLLVTALATGCGVLEPEPDVTVRIEDGAFAETASGTLEGWLRITVHNDGDQAVSYRLPCGGALERFDGDAWHRKTGALCTLALARTEVPAGATVERRLEYAGLAGPPSSAYRVRLEIIGADGRLHETWSDPFAPQP